MERVVEMPNTKSVYLDDALLNEFEGFKIAHSQKDGELIRQALREYFDKRKPELPTVV